MFQFFGSAEALLEEAKELFKDAGSVITAAGSSLHIEAAEPYIRVLLIYITDAAEPYIQKRRNLTYRRTRVLLYIYTRVSKRRKTSRTLRFSCLLSLLLSSL